MARAPRKTPRAATPEPVRVPPSKPRNPFVVPAMRRAAGVHRKSVDAVRRARIDAADRAARDDDGDDRTD